jgi:PTH1 family peptidyl-tRNA hydrolase
MKYLIVGLGNIGPEYKNTRHNIGFIALEHLAKEKKLKWKQERLAFKTEYKYKGRQIHLIRPTTFMNLSGKAIRYWMNDLNIPIENVLVLTDDIALPFDKLRLKGKGSSAGHNGLKNIEELLGGQQYARVKIGIGEEFAKGRQVDFVLGEFTKEEGEVLPFIINNTIDYINAFCTIGLQMSMNQLNKK